MAHQSMLHLQRQISFVTSKHAAFTVLVEKQAAFAAADQLYEPLVIGEATGTVTMDTAAAVSYLADVMISLGKTWRPGASTGLCFKMPRTSLSW